MSGEQEELLDRSPLLFPNTLDMVRRSVEAERRRWRRRLLVGLGVAGGVLWVGAIGLEMWLAFWMRRGDGDGFGGQRNSSEIASR